MHHGHGQVVRLEDFLDFRGGEAGDAAVEADEGGDEVYAAGGEVHDVVGEDGGLGEGFEGFWGSCAGVAAGGFLFGVDGDGVGGFEEGGGGGADEVVAV